MTGEVSTGAQSSLDQLCEVRVFGRDFGWGKGNRSHSCYGCCFMVRDSRSDCLKFEALGMSHAEIRGLIGGTAQPKMPLDGELAREVNCCLVCNNEYV